MSPKQLAAMDQAVMVAEDVISDRYHLTLSSWKKYRYDIRTLKDLRKSEIAPQVFAQIVRYGRPTPPEGLRQGDFYSICIQDHNILGALERDPDLQLYPLLLYVLTHELVHVVRFYTFLQFFHANEAEREKEETRVHRITHDLLRRISLPEMDLVFQFYADHRRLVD